MNWLGCKLLAGSLSCHSGPPTQLFFTEVYRTEVAWIWFVLSLKTGLSLSLWGMERNLARIRCWPYSYSGFNELDREKQTESRSNRKTYKHLWEVDCLLIIIKQSNNFFIIWICFLSFGCLCISSFRICHDDNMNVAIYSEEFVCVFQSAS